MTQELPKIVFATNNVNKLAEVRHQLEGRYQIVSLKEIGCEEELPETQETLQGNAIQKAQYVWDHYQTRCFADDTGLEIDALNGEPGVYSARFAGPQRSHEDNMALVLERLKGKPNRGAQFRTAIALVGEKEQEIFEGKVRGHILETKQGEQGFGYDPIFQPTLFEQSFAEMSQEQKNEISHRGLAVKKLIAYLLAL